MKHHKDIQRPRRQEGEGVGDGHMDLSEIDLRIMYICVSFETSHEGKPFLVLSTTITITFHLNQTGQHLPSDSRGRDELKVILEPPIIHTQSGQSSSPSVHQRKEK